MTEEIKVETRGREPSSSKEDIAEAMMRVVSRKGFHGATMKRVATEAGVTRGILHYYFKNKKELFFAALAVAVQNLIGTYYHVIKQPLTAVKKDSFRCLMVGRVEGMFTKEYREEYEHSKALLLSTIQSMSQLDDDQIHQVWVDLLEYWG